MSAKQHIDAPDWPVKVVYSAKRQKTVSAELKNGVLVVRAPAGLDEATLAPIIEKFRRQLAGRLRPSPQSDVALAQRAQQLNQMYFNGRLRWQSIRYVSNQHKRYGSCTPTTGTIRLSDRLAEMPGWVRDYVIVHELAHLEEANHGRRFWQLVNQYPLAERAIGYLMAAGLQDPTDDPLTTPH